MNSEIPQSVQKQENVSGRRIWMVVYCISVLTILCTVAGFYKSPYGFTRLDGFGGVVNHDSLAGAGCYIYPKNGGTDGQYYATIALDPLLRNPALGREVDNVFYRARRIFFSWTAWLLGLGRPAWIVQIFALQNVVCWLVLAWLLARWFPPRDSNNYLRWAGILFSCGMLFSLRGAFVDGPSLLLLALAMKYTVEQKPGCATALLALASLARETSVLAVFSIVEPARRSLGDWSKLALRVICIVAPLACWITYLAIHLPHGSGSSGAGNFALPFVELFRWWGCLIMEIFRGHLKQFRPLLVLLALTVQALFFFTKADCKNPWWRLGIVFAVMMMFLGRDVWEHGAGDAARALLPMQMAFNVSVPRGRGWLALLVAGNLSLVYAPAMLSSPR